MSSEIQAVRLREVPADFARAGLVVWCGPERVNVLGYRTVLVHSGWVPAPEGVKHCTLTVVQPKSQPAILPMVQDDVLSWAAEWISVKQRAG